MALTTDTSVTELLATYKDSSDTAVTDTFGYLDLGTNNLAAGDFAADELMYCIANFNSAISYQMGNPYVNSKVRQTIVINGIP